MSNTIRLAHVCLHARDLAETARFYEEGLGLDRKFEFERNGELFGFYLDLGNESFIEVFAGETKPVGNLNHLAIQVDSIDAVSERLIASGYSVTEKKMGADHSWQAWSTDPNGVRIEFHEYTAESHQLRGGRCVVNW